MLSKAQQTTFLKIFFGFDSIKAYQQSQRLTANGIWGPKTDAAAHSNMRAIQNKLNKNGASLVVDGVAGPTTVRAIKRYQQEQGIKVTGTINMETYKSLFVRVVNRNNYLSEHFKKEEFRCGCRGKWCNGYNGVEVDPRLLTILEAIRERYDSPIVITSGIRCQRYNDSLKGTLPNSSHRLGTAADIYIAGVTDTVNGRKEVRNFAYQCGAKRSYYGKINMGNSVHINV